MVVPGMLFIAACSLLVLLSYILSPPLPKADTTPVEEGHHVSQMTLRLAACPTSHSFYFSSPRRGQKEVPFPFPCEKNTLLSLPTCPFFVSPIHHLFPLSVTPTFENKGRRVVERYIKTRTELRGEPSCSRFP